MEKDRKEGIRGMANPGRYGIERVAYWLMRITGLGLLFYFIGHIYETSNLLDGKAAWNSMLELTQTTEGHIFLTLVIGMCVFHTGNGIRLMIGQAGFGIGKPSRADYPYTPKSLNMKGKLCIYVSIGLAALAMMYGLGVMYDV
jgi:succinate dehydrogenase / fumarate reductase cytochrome b subunit